MTRLLEVTLVLILLWGTVLLVGIVVHAITLPACGATDACASAGPGPNTSLLASRALVFADMLLRLLPAAFVSIFVLAVLTTGGPMFLGSLFGLFARSSDTPKLTIKKEVDWERVAWEKKRRLETVDEQAARLRAEWLQEHAARLADRRIRGGHALPAERTTLIQASTQDITAPPATPEQIKKLVDMTRLGQSAMRQAASIAALPPPPGRGGGPRSATHGSGRAATDKRRSNA